MKDATAQLDEKQTAYGQLHERALIALFDGPVEQLALLAAARLRTAPSVSDP